MHEIETYLTDHGGFGAFAALIVLKLGEMIWGYFKNRERVTDSTLRKLACDLEKTQMTLVAIQSDLRKFKLDMRRAFHALRKIAGKDWPEVAEEIRNIRDTSP